MSMTTHRFSSIETLHRAQEWLTRLGIRPDQMEVSSTGMPTLTIRGASGLLAEVEMIINAAELGDEKGLPAFDEIDPTFVLPDAEPRLPEHDGEHNSPIGWHPVD